MSVCHRKYVVLYAKIHRGVVDSIPFYVLVYKYVYLDTVSLIIVMKWMNYCWDAQHVVYARLLPL